MVYGAPIERKYFNRKYAKSKKNPKFGGQAKKKYICHIKPSIDIAKSFWR